MVKFHNTLHFNNVVKARSAVINCSSVISGLIPGSVPQIYLTEHENPGREEQKDQRRGDLCISMNQSRPASLLSVAQGRGCGEFAVHARQHGVQMVEVRDKDTFYQQISGRLIGRRDKPEETLI